MFEKNVVQSVKNFTLTGKLYVIVLTFNERRQALLIHAEPSCGFPGRAFTEALVLNTVLLVQFHFLAA